MKQAYSAILAAFAAFGSLKHASHHLTLLLVVTFGIYVYRDLYPLGTFDKSPMDLSEGDLLWPMISVLGVTGIVIPLFTPRTYTPFDPEVSCFDRLRACSVADSRTYSFRR